MTGEKLPTAAKVLATENNEGIFWESNYDKIEAGDELVRRKDVKEIIKDSMEDYDETINEAKNIPRAESSVRKNVEGCSK